MSLKKIGVLNSGLRNTWFILLTLIAFLLIGCGGSEEATNETQNPQDTVKPLGTVEQEQPKEIKPMDQALTNFLGVDTEKVVESSKSTFATRSQLSQYEKQIEDLRTENTSLKQKIGKLEQENRGMNGRISEAEAQSAAEKIRADKAEELAKNSYRTTQAVEEKPISEKPVPVSGSSYDAAMKAFNLHKYDAAAQGFNAIIASSTNSELTNRAEYWLGESYFAKKKYKEALPLFQSVLKYKNSEKKADAQFMIGQTYERLGNKAKAKEAYEKVVKNYPMSKNVKRAKARWAKL